MDLDWLRDFLALAEHGNFSRAADARNVTQPAFSRRIRALEDWIGTPLFVRSAQGAALTAAGAHFKSLAVDLARNLDRARRDTRSIGERKTTSLSVAATHALSFTFFPGWIHRHASLDTLGTLNLISDSMDACEQIMLSGEVHFLLCHHHGDAPVRFDEERFPSLTVGYDRLVPISLPDASGAPVWPVPGKTGHATRLLGYSPASGLGRILAAHPSIPAQLTGIEPVFTSHLAATLLTMVRAGQGAAWLPLTLVEDDVRLGRLVAAAPEALHVPIEIRLFRSLDCRNHVADRLWDQLCAADKSPLSQGCR